MTAPWRRIGVMGGTFDPIHFGHLLAASEAAHAHQLEHVLFIPAGDPWQKSDRVITRGELRWEMTVAAVADNPQFSASRLELDRTGATYTVDTLRELQQLHPEAELFFITGADTLAALNTWKDPEELLRLAQFIGVNRPGYELSEDHLAQAGLPVDRVHLVRMPQLSISSTDVRTRTAQGQQIRYLLPEEVRKLIVRHGLYRHS